MCGSLNNSPQHFTTVQNSSELNTGGLFERGRAPLVHFYQRPTGSADGKRMITGAFPEAQIDGFWWFFQKVDSSKTMSALFWIDGFFQKVDSSKTMSARFWRGSRILPFQEFPVSFSRSLSCLLPVLQFNWNAHWNAAGSADILFILKEELNLFVQRGIFSGVQGISSRLNIR